MRGMSRYGYGDPGGAHRGAPGREAPASRGGREVAWRSRRPGHRPVLRSSAWWSGMLSGERCVLPATEMWLAPSSGGGAGQGCRSRTRAGFPRIPRSRTRAAPRRAWAGGVRRAGLPIAYSAGFTPHPKISYAGGAPTGVASEAEYLSLALTSRRAAAEVRERLNAVLPDGIDVIDVMEDAEADGRSSATSSDSLAPTASVSPAGSVSTADSEASGSLPSGNSGSFSGLEASE